MQKKNSNKEIYNKKRNIKIYPIYKTLSWDLLFYYSISFLFLTKVKGISASQVLLAESLYTMFQFIFQIFATIIVDDIGKVKSLIFGNLMVTMGVLFEIICSNFYEIIIAQALFGFGYALKAICESNMLYDSIPRHKKRGKLFSEIDGKTTSYFYYLDAITSVSAGFLFVINPYIPMILCLVACIISTYLSTKYTETDKKGFIHKKRNKNEIKEYIKDLKDSFKYLFKARRARYLILFYGIFGGIISGIGSLRSSMLVDLAVPEEYFGIIFAVLGILSGISAKNQEKFHQKYGNSTLAHLSIPTTISCIMIGLFGKMMAIPTIIIILVIISLLTIQAIIKGPYNVLINRYLNNFSNSKLRTKISTVKNLIKSIFAAGVELLASFLLGITSTANTFVIIGCISTVIIVLLLDHMRGRVGLDPKQYSKDEVKYIIAK